MTSLPLLSLATFLPLVGVILILLFVRNRDDDHNAKGMAQQIALWTSMATLWVAAAILVRFDLSDPGFQMMERLEWIPAFHIAYIKGVDGISIWFVVISALLTPICVLSAIGGVHKLVKEFMIALLVLESMMIGVFTSLDFVLFYLFFEGILIPMFLIVGVWGGVHRIYAAYKFFIYTLLGSVLMLVAIFVMVLHTGTTDMTAMMGHKFPKEMQTLLWLAFFASFAVKMPIWPFHTWLPFAHVEAHKAGSVILAGVLLKMGGYGFIRVSMQMLPDASVDFAPMMMALSLIAIVYTSLVALVQTDMKKLIAYSSVAHMGFVTLGIFSFNQQGLDGAMMVMLSHSFVSGALFIAVGVLYDRLHTREIGDYGGVATNMPRYAFLFMILMLGAIGVPGTSGFVGEFLSLLGAYKVNGWVAAIGTTGIVLGAAYMLLLYRRIFYGPLDKPAVAAMTDLTLREYIMLVPLVVLVLAVGIRPSLMSDVFTASTQKILTDFHMQIDGAPHG